MRLAPGKSYLNRKTCPDTLVEFVEAPVGLKAFTLTPNNLYQSCLKAQHEIKKKSNTSNTDQNTSKAGCHKTIVRISKSKRPKISTLWSDRSTL